MVWYQSLQHFLLKQNYIITEANNLAFSMTLIDSISNYKLENILYRLDGL